MKKIKVWYRIEDGNMTKPFISWHLTEDESQQGDWVETASVETFEGSDIHKQAINNGF